MKQLFVMHTQYNLILSAAVLLRCKDSESTLVLFSEFSLSEEMRQALSRVFVRVIVVRDSFYKPQSALDEIREIRHCLKKIKTLKHEHFDRVYLSQERVFDKIVCRWVKRKNPQAYCCHIEEDAYYSIREAYNTEGFVYNDSPRMKRHRLLYALCLAGYPYDYREVTYCYGMSREYHGAALLFPALARKEVADKELTEITRDELMTGIDALYSQRAVVYPKGDKYLLVFFDLMDRYRSPEKVKAIVGELLQVARREGRAILFKYHPRETDKFEEVEGAVELPHLVPAEKVLLDLKDTDTVVVGNATTACVVAAKLGFRVCSICKLEFPTNTAIHRAMNNMGVTCIQDVVDIQKYIM